MIIGLTGRAGSGKTTIANYLLEASGHRPMEIVGFADALKQGVSALLGLDDIDAFKDYGYVEVSTGVPDGLHILTGREILQRYGYEAHRLLFGDNFWIKVLSRKLTDFSVNRWGPCDLVVSDVRYINEASIIRAKGGLLWHVYRPGLPRDAHSSEQPLPFYQGDFSIRNTGDLNALRDEVNRQYRHLLSDVTLPDDSGVE